VTEQSERVLGAHLARLERLAEAGSTTGLEVTRTRARLASVRVQTLQAKAAEAMAQLSLIITLGLEPDAVLELREPLDDAPPADDEQRRPELLAARAQVAAKQAQARAAAGGLWPQIALRASVQLDSPNSRYFPLRNQLNPSWEASAILSWTAWDWGATWHGLRAAQLDAQAAHHGVEQLEDAVRLEVARRRLDVTTAAARTVATREAVDAADQSFQRAQRQCDEGQLACIIALDAEAELSRLRADLVQARIEQRPLGGAAPPGPRNAHSSRHAMTQRSKHTSRLDALPPPARAVARARADGSPLEARTPTLLASRLGAAALTARDTSCTCAPSSSSLSSRSPAARSHRPPSPRRGRCGSRR
jgi:outer membrane protein TolC